MKAETISLFSVTIMLNFVFIFFSSKDFYSKMFAYKNKFNANKLVNNFVNFVKGVDKSNITSLSDTVKQTYFTFYDNYSVFFKFIN